mmetsp:Transcript_28881/g.35688  ORF Transcript_28881/g.35688 Transcript_28881/m.35688 type:complete len:95 (-) Transcript_28881:67-351(-)
MLFIYIFSLAFTLYFTLSIFIKDEEDELFNADYWVFLPATFGLGSIQVADWLFTEQYLVAALNLPVVICIFDQDTVHGSTLFSMTKKDTTNSSP